MMVLIGKMTFTNITLKQTLGSSYNFLHQTKVHKSQGRFNKPFKTNKNK